MTHARRSPLRGALLAASLLVAAPAGAQRKTFTFSADFDTGTYQDAVSTNPANQVVLGPAPVTGTDTVWSDNYIYGWIVKLDGLTGKQLGRYDSSLQFLNGVATGAPPPNEYCDFGTTGNCPGRIAVDHFGDAWIVNRAFGKQGSLTRIAGSLARCQDRNNNGVIDTSFDANNDGQISVVPVAGEYFGQNDECVVTTIKIGPNNAWPRGVAVDKRGRIWVGTHQDGKVYRLNPYPPHAIEATVTVGGNPYSLALGKDYVFVSSSSGNLVRRVHIDNLTTQTVACAGVAGTYGLVADPGGDIVWLGGYFTGLALYRANFANNTCTAFNTGSQVTAITMDLQGNIWACGYNTNTIHKLNPAGVLLGTYPSGGTSPHGLAVDRSGNLWVLNHGPTPNMTKVNVNTGAIIGTYPVGGPGVPNADPYNYADFTGQQLARQSPYAFLGRWRVVHDGGVPGMPWRLLRWNTEPQGATPAETRLAVAVRAADDPADLAAIPLAAASNNVALPGGIVGRHLEIVVELAGPGFVTPALSDLTIEGPCDPAQIGPACCLSAADCDDGDACTADSCPTPGGACAHAAVAGCCNADAACDDGDACTTDTCSGLGGTCGHAAVAGCCNTDAPCDDGDACTRDTCSGRGGTCGHTAIAGCCSEQAACDDRDACTTDTCSGPGGTCGHAAVAGCCNAADQCDDGDACTTDTCSGPGGTCGHAAVAGCCNVAADCDDGDACTTDTCSGRGGACRRSPVAGCCNANGDCLPGGRCEMHTCMNPSPDLALPVGAEPPTGAAPGGCAVSAGRRSPPGLGASLAAALLLALARLSGPRRRPRAPRRRAR